MLDLRYLETLIGLVGAICLTFVLHGRPKGPVAPPAPIMEDKPLEPPPAVPEPVTVPSTDPYPPIKPTMTKSEIVYAAARDLMGKHLTLNDDVPEEVGCCEALSYVLKQVGYDVPHKGIEGVNAIIAWMLGKGFAEVHLPQAGDIITAHSPAYYEQTGAHVGVVMNHGICSNTSANGLWQENYVSLAAWRAAFSKSTVRFFRPQ